MTTKRIFFFFTILANGKNILVQSFSLLEIIISVWKS